MVRSNWKYHFYELNAQEHHHRVIITVLSLSPFFKTVRKYSGRTCFDGEFAEMNGIVFLFYNKTSQVALTKHKSTVQL